MYVDCGCALPENAPFARQTFVLGTTGEVLIQSAINIITTCFLYLVKRFKITFIKIFSPSLDCVREIVFGISEGLICRATDLLGEIDQILLPGSTVHKEHLKYASSSPSSAVLPYTLHCVCIKFSCQHIRVIC